MTRPEMQRRRILVSGSLLDRTMPRRSVAKLMAMSIMCLLLVPCGKADVRHITYERQQGWPGGVIYRVGFAGDLDRQLVLALTKDGGPAASRHPLKRWFQRPFCPLRRRPKNSNRNNGCDLLCYHRASFSLERFQAKNNEV
jgi:hypothetical protein